MLICIFFKVGLYWVTIGIYEPIKKWYPSAVNRLPVFGESPIQRCANHLSRKEKFFRVI